MVRKIISGGECGAERAALDAAVKNGIKIGGWCVKGKQCSDGILPAKYELKETAGESPLQKEELNFRDAHGTLVFYNGVPNGFTHHIDELSHKHQKPYLLVNLLSDVTEEKDVIKLWLDANKIITLNVTGLNEDENTDVYKQSLNIMNKVLLECKIEDEDEYND